MFALHRHNQISRFHQLVGRLQSQSGRVDNGLHRWSLLHLQWSRSFSAQQENPSSLLDPHPSQLRDLKSVLRDWEPCIGIEIHAQILSESKLFSGASTKPYAQPNSQVSVVDAALPGVLPVVNQECVHQGIRLGLALGSEVQERSRFVRKHYSYCDMPQGYQLTQQDDPICTGGVLEVQNEAQPDNPLRVRIERIQLEQDSGKNIHDVHPLQTFVDYNRAGVGLLEIVSHPDMRSSREAGLFVSKLQSLMSHIDVCSGHMHDGSMRCDVNISIRPRKKAGSGEEVPMGERVEIKNLNSIKAVRNSIDFEVRRQAYLSEIGHPVQRATRTYSAGTGTTGHLRSKEQLLDYRFMPCGDLPLLQVEPATIQMLRDTLPELPDQTVERLKSLYDLSPAQSRILMNEPGALRYLEALMAVPNTAGEEKDVEEMPEDTARYPREPQKAVNWFCNELFGAIRKQQEKLLERVDEDTAAQVVEDATSVLELERVGVHRGMTAGPMVSPEYLAELIDLVESETISGKVGKKVVEVMMEEIYTPGAKDDLKTPLQLVEERGWKQISDPKILGEICDRTISEEPDMVAEYHVRNAPRVFSALVNAALVRSKGLANPVLLRSLLVERVGEPIPDGRKARKKQQQQ